MWVVPLLNSKITKELARIAAYRMPHHNVPEKEAMKAIQSAEITPAPGQSAQAARALQNMGFRVLHIGRTISVEGQQELWIRIFGVTFRIKKKVQSRETGTESLYYEARMETLKIPDDLKALITDVAFMEPPEFFA